MFLHVEIFGEDLLDIGLVDHPAGDRLFFLFFLDDDVGGVDLLFVQFARLLFFYGFDGGFFLVAKFWAKGY